MDGTGFCNAFCNSKTILSNSIYIWLLFVGILIFAWGSLQLSTAHSSFLQPKDCQSPSPGQGAKINVLPFLTALSPPSCRPLDISCGTPETPSKLASIPQLHGSTLFTPGAWNEGTSTRAILSAWTAKAISRVLHQLTAQAFLPFPISSQGIFGRQKAGWCFSLKLKIQLSLRACSEPCKTLMDLHWGRDPMWAKAAQWDHDYILLLPICHLWRPEEKLSSSSLLCSRQQSKLTTIYGSFRSSYVTNKGNASDFIDIIGLTFWCPICKPLLTIHKQGKETWSLKMRLTPMQLCSSLSPPHPTPPCWHLEPPHSTGP